MMRENGSWCGSDSGQSMEDTNKSRQVLERQDCEPLSSSSSGEDMLSLFAERQVKNSPQILLTTYMQLQFTHSILFITCRNPRKYLTSNQLSSFMTSSPTALESVSLSLSARSIAFNLIFSYR